MAADIATLKTAEKSTVVEAAPSLNGRPMWTLHHFENGKGTGRSFARGDEIADWLTDLTGAGRVIGLRWELCDCGPHDAPDGWPRDYQCGHCSEWAPHDGTPDDGNFYCESCGAHMVLAEVESRAVTVEEIVDRYRGASC